MIHVYLPLVTGTWCLNTTGVITMFPNLTSVFCVCEFTNILKCDSNKIQAFYNQAFFFAGFYFAPTLKGEDLRFPFVKYFRHKRHNHPYKKMFKFN